MAAAERWTPRGGTRLEDTTPTCAIHPDIAADRVCARCAAYACSDCALVRTIRDRQYEACPSCRGMLVGVGARGLVADALPLPDLESARATPLPPPQPAQVVGPRWPAPQEQSGVNRIEGGSVGAHVERSATLFALLPSALAYPLQGPGIFVIVTGTVFTWVIGLLSRAPLVGIIAAIFGAGYLAAYTLKVIEASAHGEKHLPPYPDFSDFWEDLLAPLMRVLSASFVSFALPCGLAAFAVVKGGASPMLIVVAAALGLLYFPMALVAVAVRRTFFAASPHIVLRMIVAAPLEYGIACALVGALIGIRVAVHLTLAVVIPILGFFVGDLVAFYLLLVELRVLGLIYHVGRARLDWLEAA
ncbi:MAG: DUF4013 domain-containing protein [Deltaproteobacteria bacterium]|nr:DUF4013 domain-containing protein [Deltaproteobacteria bacterium]